MLKEKFKLVCDDQDNNFHNTYIAFIPFFEADANPFLPGGPHALGPLALAAGLEEGDAHTRGHGVGQGELAGLVHHQDRSQGAGAEAVHRGERKVAVGRRLTGPDLELLLELVHHPEHVLARRHNIGRRDILHRTDILRQLTHPAAAQGLLLPTGELVGIAHRAPHAAAERDVRDGGFPGCPHGQRTDGVDGFLGVKANAAPGRV